MAGIFKAYDIRGIYGEDLTEEVAHAIGRAFATLLKPQKIVLGRDMRPHSKPLFAALAEGLTLQGVDVVDLGLCSTPMSYFGNGHLGADGSIMITASHNTGEWNGFKMCRAEANPISGANGIQDLEDMVKTQAFDEPADSRGSITSHEIQEEYIAHIRSFQNLKRPIKLVVDFANAMGLVENRVLDGLVDYVPLFDELDGTFPNHEANPLIPETYDALCAKVREVDCDFGIAYDGDADRVGFVDELGTIIPMDMITALIAEMVLEENAGATIFYDLRSSWSVKEVIEESGGKPMMSRVGHAFIKQQMREAESLFAGELSGHYYFRDNYFAESSSLAVLYVANLVSQSEKTLSELIKPVQRYAASGEINSTVEDVDAVFVRLKDAYGDARMFNLDGWTFEYDDWWFNVRSSNTEPLVRLNLETRTDGMLAGKRDEVLALIRA